MKLKTLLILGAIVMALGGLIAVTDRRYRTGGDS